MAAVVVTLSAVSVVAITLVLTNSEDASEPGLAAMEWTPDALASGPRLAVDRTSVDRGEVDYGELVEATYRLKNVGDEVVVIDQPSIRTLEGC